MVRAIWNDTVLAESDDVVVVDGFTYFPRDSIDPAVLADSPHTSVCAWKGTANYFTVVVDGKENPDAAWFYPKPSMAAAKVKDRVAFWRGVEVVADDSEPGARPTGLMDRVRARLHPAPDTTPEHAADADDHEPSPVIDLDDASFLDGTAGTWTVVDFWAPWCGPCRSFHPVFDQAARDHDSLRFARCDVDASPQSAAAVGILSIPTVVLFDPDGNEADRIIGVPNRKDFARLLAHPVTAAER